MNVFYFSSDMFVSTAAVSIVSLMENNKSFESIHFYVVDDGITNENKIKLINMVSKYKREIDFIQAPDPSKVFRFPFKDRYQIGHSYVRMCIGTLLPQSVERVLCLDSDTLISGDLTELWNRDIGDNILAGVSDCVNLRAYRKRFYLQDDEVYCNAGVFLVDLKKWRDNKIEERITDVIHRQNGNVFFFEQTVINYVCRGRIYSLPPKYNVYTLFYAFDYKNLIRWRKPTRFYKEEEIIAAKDKPYIIHFTRNFYMLSRPWMENCDHPVRNEYIRYKQLTPWESPEKNEITVKKRFRYGLFHMIPKCILCKAAGFLYNFVRPKMYWRND